jgi:hypothetical protein
VAAIVDVRAGDTDVYVVEWGKTKIEVIERGLADAGNVTDRLLGVVLNKVECPCRAAMSFIMEINITRSIMRNMAIGISIPFGPAKRFILPNSNSLRLRDFLTHVIPYKR